MCFLNRADSASLPCLPARKTRIYGRNSLRTHGCFKGLVIVLVCLVASLCPAEITLNPDGYFRGPGFNFLVYHNAYIGGRQGGLQMLLHGTRVLDAGTLFYRTVVVVGQRLESMYQLALPEPDQWLTQRKWPSSRRRESRNVRFSVPFLRKYETCGAKRDSFKEPFNEKQRLQRLGLVLGNACACNELRRHVEQMTRPERLATVPRGGRRNRRRVEDCGLLILRKGFRAISH